MLLADSWHANLIRRNRMKGAVMFRDILVSVDGSEDSRRALSEAIDLARAEHARLTVLTAVPQPLSSVYTPASAGVVTELAAELEQESGAILHDATSQIPADLPVTTILTHDPIRRALLQRIDAGGHDLLIMGSRGRGALRSALLGSVSHFALHHSPVPVLIVHADRPAVTKSKTRAVAA